MFPSDMPLGLILQQVIFITLAECIREKSVYCLYGTKIGSYHLFGANFVFQAGLKCMEGLKSCIYDLVRSLNPRARSHMKKQPAYSEAHHARRI